MKNGFWDRVLVFLYVLLTGALVVLVALQVFGIDLLTPFYDGLAEQAPDIVWKLIISGIGAILVLLGIFVLLAIQPVRKTKRAFITLTNDENGQVKIALPALREMAAQAVGNAAGLKDMQVDISDAGDAITVLIMLDIVSGTHVPTVTMNMQRAVRSYIQMNCGVAVNDVSVIINSVLPAQEAQPAPDIVSGDAPLQETEQQMPLQEQAQKTVHEFEETVPEEAEPIEEQSTPIPVAPSERDELFEPEMFYDEEPEKMGAGEEMDESIREKAE